MKRNLKTGKYFFIYAVFLLFTLCQTKTGSEASLGQLNLSISGKPKAQEAFHKGLLFLHSFEYVDALEAFQQAQMEDLNA